MGNKHGKTNEDISPTSTQSSLPSSMDEFELQELLGQGTFACVYKARSCWSGQCFAIKCVKKQAITSTTGKDQVFTERSILAEVDSPFVVKLHCAFQTNSRLCMVMDYMAGGTLFELLSHRGHFSAIQTAFYAAEVALGLEALHNHSIVYRDLKLENVLLDASGHAKLSDFNLSKRTDPAVPCTSLAGTAEYLAPEALSRKGYSVSVDFWALGVLIYELLAGKPPFYSPNQATVYQNILEEDVVFESGFSFDACDLIDDLLEKDPERRLQSFEKLKQHAFFRDIDWDALARKLIHPPLRPMVELRTAATEIESETESTEFYEDFYDNFNYNDLSTPVFGESELGA